MKYQEKLAKNIIVTLVRKNLMIELGCGDIIKNVIKKLTKMKYQIKNLL